jgi:hypothetical protein
MWSVPEVEPVTCSKCRYNLSAKDLAKAQGQIAQGVLVCPNCQQVILNNGIALGDVSRRDDGTFTPSKRLEIKTSPHELRISIPWLTRNTWAFFSTGILFSTIAFVTFDEPSLRSVLRLFPIVVIGAGSLISALMQIFNKSFVVVTSEKLAIGVHPISTRRGSSYSTSEIVTVVAQKKTYRDPDGRERDLNRVDVVLNNGKSHKILDTQSADESLHIEHEIRTYMNIQADTRQERRGS